MRVCESLGLVFEGFSETNTDALQRGTTRVEVPGFPAESESWHEGVRGESRHPHPGRQQSRADPCRPKAVFEEACGVLDKCLESLLSGFNFARSERESA